MSEVSSDGPSGDETPSPEVPPPIPPDDPEAWYAPDVRAQYELHPGVVATIRDTDDGFDYLVREPSLSPAGEDALARVADHFSTANLERPLTREGATERMAAGFDPKYRRIIDRLTDLPPDARRRVEYRALRDLRCLGDLTPLALDDGIEVADTAGENLVVHTDDYAPADTRLPSDADFLERFASERVETHTVDFRSFRVPVVVYREHLLANDAFTTKYAVLEPDLLPGDEELIRECKDRIWETNVDGVVEDRAAFVRERARTFLSRRLTARNTRAWLDAAAYRARTALAEYDLAVPPVNHRFSTDRLSDLVYYVMRDFVGHGKLTIPIRDDLLEDIEANRVDERIKVVPRGREIGHGERIPTNLRFEDESAFVNVVTQMAASDGTELNASNPSAKVNLDPAGVPDGTTIRCAVALGVISEDGPHISIRKQAPEAMTPVDLLESDSLSTEMVTLLWQAYEHHGVVLFSGPTGAGKTTLMNAHMPFVPYRDRPISIDEGSREVRLPHETGVSLTTRDHESDYKRVTMADLMTECNYLNPDVEVIAEINTPASFETFAETLNTGHGVIGTTHAEDVEKLVNRVIEQGLPSYLLQELDLVVFPQRVDGERYVGEVVELLTESEFADLDSARARCGTVRKDDVTVYWNTVAWRDTEGEFHLAYDHPRLDGGGDERARRLRFFDRLANRTDRTVEEVEAEFHRKHGYVQYLEREGMDDFDELFGFLSDLQTNEAATVERAGRGTV
ncbi:type II/IV secretion system ATPase subunit [Halorussus salilacus]|uniref:type II/IV secretion system ATPase subunit n=1 Tax=Halorussus salilacus TaxID=2953750 RepID=UPI00209E13CC|nr:type II/IV secretion system ATPase subunit [Halorussus salilacus]USZ69216.1 type II/IV secretion system ATPase subunit [Halorussus salilacus]